MKIEWNYSKNATNRQKHQLDFSDAAEVLTGEHIVFQDARKDYGETRYITAGSLRERIVILVYTMRGESYRIISMRKANEREQKAYKNRLKKTG
ncbi:MAG: BrnT family toxin [Coxiellaceae bacterium]|nr:BrnT family toxin [Coxiellaceae bacterium]